LAFPMNRCDTLSVADPWVVKVRMVVRRGFGRHRWWLKPG
jgi:hypothetical protein